MLAKLLDIYDRDRHQEGEGYLITSLGCHTGKGVRHRFYVSSSCRDQANTANIPRRGRKVASFPKEDTRLLGKER